MNSKITLMAAIILSAVLFTNSSLAARNSGSYDLAVSIDNYPDAVITVGSQAGYQINISNVGTATARRSKLILELNPHVIPTAGLDSRCSVNGSDQIVCDLGSLRAGRGTSVNLAFEMTTAMAYQFDASATARRSDANSANNQAQHSFLVEPDSIIPYAWNEPNNVLISSTSNYTNGSTGVGRHYGTLYTADINGAGVGVIDGIISTYTIDTNTQTIDVTRGVNPGDLLAVGAQAIDSVSYQQIELNPVLGIDDRTTAVCLYDDDNAVYVHPYSDLFPVQSATQANLGVSIANAWTVVSYTPKLATFFPGGMVDINGAQYTYTATRDELKIVDQNNALIHHAVRSWNDQYMDISPSSFDIQTGTGIIAVFTFTP